MNGEVNHTMEDIIGITLVNVENSQEIIETPCVNSVKHNELAEIPLVNSKQQEEIVQMVVAKSFSENSLTNSEKQEEVANIHLENSEEVNEIGLAPFKNIGVPNQIIETIHTSSQELEDIDIDSRKTATTPENLENPENIQSLVDIKEPERIKDSDIGDTGDFDQSVKIPFRDVNNTEKIIATPIALSEEPEDSEEMRLGDSEGPVKTSQISLIKKEDIKEIIEISLVNSEDSKQSTDLENIDNEDHVIQIPTTESINDVYNDSSQEAVINGNIDHSESDNNIGNDGMISEVTTIKIFDLLPEAEFNSNDVEHQHCSNSNGSFAESLASSQIKSETTCQQPIDSYNENGDNYIKSENGSQHSEDVADLDNITDVDMSEEELKATDTVSINSDTEPEHDLLIPLNEELSQENQSKVNTSESVKEGDEIEGSNGDSQKVSSPEIHEIDSENEDIKEVKSQTHEDPVPLRRSSRAIKRKRYTDDLENVDDFEPVLGDSLKHKSRPVVLNNTKIVIEMEDKNPRYNQGNKQRKESTVVIITATSERPSSNRGSGHSTYFNQNIHNVHPNTNTLPNRSNTVVNHSPQAPSILPSLTDDMYVVEAPSFIVPYVYEKPSMMPFKEFVNNLGKELEEERIKQKELLKENKSTENNDKDKAGQERNEESGDDEDKKKKKEAKKEKRRLKQDDDDISWDGESTTESEEDILSDEEDKISIIKDKEYTINEIHSTSTDVSANKLISRKSDSYFDCSLGKFFMDIGSNLVQEYVQNDLLKQQNRKMYRAKKLGHSTKSTETSIASLKKNLELSKENNSAYTLKLKKCQFCTFKTESSLILAEHLEIPHMKNNLYQCNFCSFEVKNAHEIFIHMETVHSVRGKLARLPGCHQCANCPFEDNSKGKLARHLIPCMKKFKPELNLAPPFDWEPPAKIPKISKARNNMVTTYQNTFNRGQIGNIISRPMNVTNAAPGVSATYRPRGRSPMPVPPRPVPVLHGLPIMRNTVMVKHNTTIANSNIAMKQKSSHQPSISITPLPRQPQPIQSQQANPKTTFVICEICDGYIKDLEQLRNHMQSIHKVKIHPKMIYNRPPLNCQKCQFRFFTDQGLERHLLGSHGLVTSSMQEAANKEKDSGRCPVCGRVYQWKLLSHVARDHNLTLKPAHLSYKCTVCAATFGMYKQFENHVYSAHSVVAKRVIDKSKTPPSLNKYHGNSTLHNKPEN